MRKGKHIRIILARLEPARDPGKVQRLSLLPGDR